MADDGATTPLPASQYNQVLAGTTPDRVCGVDSEEVDRLDDFSTPIGAQIEGGIGCAASTTTENTNEGNLSKVLFGNGVTTHYECNHQASASEGPQRTAEGPFLQPEVFRSPEAKKIAQVIKLNEHRFERGYDSDGEIGPFFDAIEEEGVQDYDDDEAIPEDSDDLTFPQADVLTENAGENADQPTQEADAPSNPPANPPVSVAANSNSIAATVIVRPSSHVMTVEMIDGLNVMDLKKACRKKGLKVAGKKQDLVERLRKAIRKGVPDKTQKGKSMQLVKKNVNDDDDEVDEVKGFAPGAYWKTLLKNPIAVPEPENPGFTNARAPTVPEDEAAVAPPIKYHFDETFDRAVFKGKLKEKVLLRNGRQKKGRMGRMRQGRFRMRKAGRIPIL
jgi:hypothetical protein